MNRQELEELTKAELQEHAEVSGVKLGALDNKGTMIDKILGDHVEPKTAKKKEEKLSPLGALHTLQGERVNGRKYKVKIFATEAEKSDVDLICNGHNLRIQRGQEVVIDEAYVNILRDAIIQTIVQDPDTGVRSVQERMVFPHQAIPV